MRKPTREELINLIREYSRGKESRSEFLIKYFVLFYERPPTTEEIIEKLNISQSQAYKVKQNNIKIKQETQNNEKSQDPARKLRIGNYG
jgi:hypothetical protein